MKYGKCKCLVVHKTISKYKLPEGFFVIVLIDVRILETYELYISYTFAIITPLYRVHMEWNQKLTLSQFECKWIP